MWYTVGTEKLLTAAMLQTSGGLRNTCIGGVSMDTLPPHAENGNPRKKLRIYNGRYPNQRNRRGDTMVVYALVDPRNSSVRYIGITNNLLGRLNEHMRLYGGNVRKNAWLQELIDAHMLPIMRTLEVIEVFEETREREIAWIKAYVDNGADLLNDEVQP